MSHDPSQVPDGEMSFTGERFLPGVSGEIEMEHYHRYQLASRIVAGKDVLDIACGEGYGSALLSIGAARVTGVDIDAVAVAHAAATYPREGLEFKLGSCAAIPVPDASVDVVVSFETIEHHNQHQEMMAEIVRVLRPGGVLMMSSPDRYEYSDRPGFRNEFHVKELYRQELEALVGDYFPNYRLLGQRTTMASMIGRVADGGGAAEPVAPGIHYWTESEGLESVRSGSMPREPVYFIVLASAGALPSLPDSVFEVPGYFESRVQQVADDYRREISRIGQERDGMLRDKDVAWEARVEQVAADYRSEITRIAAERDQALADKDAAWEAELRKVAREYEDARGAGTAGCDSAGPTARMEAAPATVPAGHGAGSLAIDSDDGAGAGGAGDWTGMLPLVSLIVVNYNGMRYLQPLLASLDALNYPRYEVVMVDNASSDGSVDFVRSAFPWVRIVESGGNLGFAGGNNLGMQVARGDLIGLINNDTVVDPDWLSALVRALMDEPDVTAAGSKILFFRRYVELTIESLPFQPSAGGQSSDTRELGMLVDEASGFVESGYKKPLYGEGFWGREQHGDRSVRWTSGRGTIRLPLPPDPVDGGYVLELDVSGTNAAAGREFTVSLAGTVLGTGVLAADYAKHVFTCPAALLDGAACDVINNAGTLLDGNGEAGDRGIYEDDRGQYDEPEDMQALCGAAMLMRRSALVQAGLFDSNFFMYYEDTDLSWRLRKGGGRLRYVPASVVRHVHTGSSVEWSPVFVFHVSRNHVLIKIKHAPAAVAGRAYGREVLRCLRSAVAAARRGFTDKRLNAEFGLRLRIQRDLFKLLPVVLRQRWGGLPSCKDRIGAVPA